MPSALGPACGLCGFSGVHVARDVSTLRYYHVLLERHAIMIANGMACESFYPGEMALSLVDPMKRLTLRRRYPNIARDPVAAYGPMALPALSRSETRLLASTGDRGIGNCRALENAPLQRLSA